MNNLFSYRGRMRRRDFIICEVVVMTLNFYLFLSAFTFYYGFYIITIAFLLNTINLFQIIKRLHDVNQSGLFTLFIFTPLFPLLMLYLFFKKGNEGRNSYGDDPKAQY